MNGSPLHALSGPAVEAIDLVKQFGDTVAVDGISFSVPDRLRARRARPQRRRQDHHRPDAHHDVAADQRHRPGRRVTTSSTDPDAVRRSMGLTGQAATVDELLTGRENIRLIGRFAGLSEDRGAAGRRRAARAVLAHRRRRPGREDLLRRHAAPARPRGQPGRHPAGAVPRRADHRARPAQPHRAVGGAARAGRRRHDAAADHAVPRGGRPARRRHHRHRQGRGSSPRAPRRSSRTRPGGPASWSPSPPPTTSSAAAAVVRRLSPDELHVDHGGAPDHRQAGGLDDMVAIGDGGRRPAASRIDDLGLQRPSLDDVFLRLTGHRAETDADDDADRGRRSTERPTR